MKKSSISAAVIAVLFAGSLASCSNNQQSTVAPVATLAEGATLPIAYVNTDSLLANFDMAKDLNEELISRRRSMSSSVRFRPMPSSMNSVPSRRLTDSRTRRISSISSTTSFRTTSHRSRLR